jgi:hypothetical protein
MLGYHYYPEKEKDGSNTQAIQLASTSNTFPSNRFILQPKTPQGLFRQQIRIHKYFSSPYTNFSSITKSGTIASKLHARHEESARYESLLPELGYLLEDIEQQILKSIFS